jgi:biotin carboxylase
MRETAFAAGLRIPGFAAVRTPADVLEFAEGSGFPVVVKARLGTGTAGIKVVRSGQDLKSPGVLGRLPRQDLGRLIVEEYIDAPMYHVDGISLSGEVIHCWPSRSSGGALEDVARCGPRTGVMLSADDPLRPVLQDFAARVIAAFPSGNAGFGFNLEAWVPAGGEPILCEVTSRAGTEVIAAAYQHGFGVNLFEESFRAQAGLPLQLNKQPGKPQRYADWGCFLTEDGIFTPPPDAGRPPTLYFHMDLEPGTCGRRARTITDVAARAVVEGASADEAEDRLRELTDWWSTSDPWQ